MAVLFPAASTTARFQTPVSSMLLPLHKGTVAFWAKPVSTTTTNRYWWFLYSNITVNGCQFQYFDPNMFIGFANSGGDQRLNFDATGIFTGGVWKHHVFTWNDGVTVTEAYYVNTALLASRASSLTVHQCNYLAIGNKVTIEGANSPCDSSMADLCIWNTDLTVADMRALMFGRSPAFVRPESLVAWYPLNSTVGSAVDHSRINNAVGLPFGSMSLTPNPPLLTDVSPQIPLTLPTLVPPPAPPLELMGQIWM